MAAAGDNSGSMPNDATSLHVRRAVDGNSASVGWLVERLSPVLIAQARWRLGAKLSHLCEAGDLVQEAWLVTLPRLNGLRARGGRLTPVLLRYLSTVILRRVQNMLRNEARRLVHDNDDEHEGPMTQLPADTTGVVSEVLRNEREDIVHDALRELGEADCEAILMRGIEQQDLDVVAEHFGVSSRAMSKRYNRALARLRDRLPDSVFDELDDESEDGSD